jgi:hypothetical protein
MHGRMVTLVVCLYWLIGCFVVLQFAECFVSSVRYLCLVHGRTTLELVRGFAWCATRATNSTKQSPTWEAYTHSSSEEIPRLFWNPKVHYHVHKSPSLVPILSQIKPVHTFSPCFCEIQFNIILPAMPRSSVWLLLNRFRDKNRVYISCLPMRATRSADLILLYVFTLTIFGEAYKSRSSSLCSLFQPPPTMFILWMWVVSLMMTNQLHAGWWWLVAGSFFTADCSPLRHGMCALFVDISLVVACLASW